MSDPTQDPSAENSTEQAAAADQEPQDQLPENTVSFEDAGTWKKKVTITVPRPRIDAKLNEMFGELASTAQVPGFRVGHAPRRLIEKRFGKDITNDVRNSLVGESISKLAEKGELRTISEPDLKLEDIALPDTGDLTFSFEVEVAPEFTLPEVKGIKVRRPVVTIDQKRVDDALENIRRGQATLQDTDEAAQAGDVVLVGAKITGEGVETLERHGLTMRVSAGQIEGLPLLDLDTALAGKKAGETASLTVKAPEAHPTEAWRGKDLTVDLTISQVRKNVLPEADDAFATGMGFESLEQLKEHIKIRLQGRVQEEVQQALRNQIVKYLLDSITFELPEGVVARHAQRVLSRRAMDLMHQGIPQEDIERNLAHLRAAASEQAKSDMRLSFILGKYAEDEKIEVSDGEVNSRVAQMAAQYNRRPERVRQEMEADGSIRTLYDVLTEEKALDKLLDQAEITEVTEDQAKAEAEAAEKAAQEKAAAEQTPEAKPQE